MIPKAPAPHQTDLKAVSSRLTISCPLFPALPVRIVGRARHVSRLGKFLTHDGNDLTMDKFVIRGGNPLLGTIRVSGAKNAALPAMAAALLTDEPVVLENIPQVRDIETTRKLLAAPKSNWDMAGRNIAPPYAPAI